MTPAWEVEPEGWAAADDTRGWDVDGYVAVALARLPEFRTVLAGPTPLDASIEAVVPVLANPGVAEREALVFAKALFQASRRRVELSVLDWGGGLGFSGLLARVIVPDDVVLEYHVREHSRVVTAGEDAVPEVQFWGTDACFDRTYDLVVASSSLQYAPEWQSLLARFAAVATNGVLLTRVPVVERVPAFVVRQRVPEYATEYLGWVFNRGELLDAAAQAGLRLVREYVLGYRPDVAGAPEPDETRAYPFAGSAPDRPV